jgi:NAD(P)-dependent dehydrogenase (short-subunit alcohol dehydrogenase family)
MKDNLFLNTDSKLFDYQLEPVADKSILITGGTTGIGRATAILLAAQGARVMIFGRHEQELNDAMNDIRETGGDVMGLTADVSDPDDIQRVFKEFDQQMEKLDILINNAALGYGSVMEGGYPEWDYILKTNLLGYMAMTNEAVERM